MNNRPFTGPDRRPVLRRVHLQSRVFAVAASVAALVLSLSVVWWQFRPFDDPITSSESSAAYRMEEAAPGVASEAMDRGTNERAELDEAVQGKALAGAPAELEDRSTLEWEVSWDDTGNEVVRLARNLDFLETRNQGLDWDEPAMPLELLTPNAGRHASGIQPARQNR